MKQNSIKDQSLPKLRPDNYENIFNVYIDSNDMYFYNILQTISFPTNLPKGYFNEYNIVYGDTWPLISYKTYNTPNLWWVILLANDIINPVNQPQIGEKIKVPINSVAQAILQQISSNDNG
jgi:nucleoid-associated protein YgaU